MLEKCCAYLIARTDKQTESLRKIGAQLGFGALETLDSPHGFLQAERKFSITFFLFHHQLGESHFEAVLAAVRKSEQKEIRFAPTILFLEDCPFEIYLRYVKLGFDDALTLPEKREMLISRAEKLLEYPQVYFSVSGYLGPDRRRYELGGTREESKVTQTHEEITFVRRVNSGIEIQQRVKMRGKTLVQRLNPETL